MTKFYDKVQLYKRERGLKKQMNGLQLTKIQQPNDLTYTKKIELKRKKRKEVNAYVLTR